MIPRRVRIIRPTAIEGQLLPVEDVLHYPGLVLLGEPGVGKSTVFETLHAREGGKLVTAKQFSIYGAASAAGGTLFVDALDEKRPRTAPGETTERLIQRLLDTRPNKLRLSCRTINWLGISDERDFEPMFSGLGEFALARLEPLNRTETAQLLRELGEADVDRFIQQATSRGIERLLENPQTLKMLVRTVRQRGDWPTSRRELFRLAVTDLLTEVNPTQQTQTDGAFSADELRPVAGALSASMLISDVERLTLSGAELDEHAPPLRSVPLSPAQLEACASRPLFEADANRGIRPPHRSVQEYLAAEWLAEKVRGGHSLRRAMALISVDGSPASELRGLYGWLPTLLPDQAAELLANDPYGFVTHGAPESLTPSTRRALFSALARLSIEHPGFRRGDWPNAKLAMLSGSELVDDFRAVLSQSEPPFDLLMTVLDALQFAPLPGLATELLSTMAEVDQPFSAQQSAMLAMLKLDGPERQMVIDFIRGPARGREDTIRLRVQAAELLFPQELDVDDLTAIIRDYVNRRRDNVVGMLWDMRDLADRIEPAHLDAFIGGDLGQVERRGISSTEPRPMMLHWIAGVLQRYPDTPAGQLWPWLSAAIQFRDGYTRDAAHDELRNLLRETPGLGATLYRTALLEADDEHLARFWRDFGFATLGVFQADFFMEQALNLVPQDHLPEQKRAAIYGMALRLSFGTRFFDPLYELAEADTDLQPARHSACYWPIHDWQIEDRQRTDAHERKRQRQQAANQANFDRHRETIAAGRNGGWLGHLAYGYYFRNPPQRFDEPAPARLDRIGLIATEFGAERAELARQGMISLTAVAEWPSIDHVLATCANERILHWWLAAIAGMDERWTEQESIDGVSIEGLRALCAIATCYRLSISDGRTKRWSETWLAEAFERHPETMLATLLACINNQIGRLTQSTTIGIDELPKIVSLQNQRPEIALTLLRQRVPGLYNVRSLSRIAASSANLWPELADMAGQCATDDSYSVELQDYWLGLAFWIAFERFESQLAVRYRDRPEAIWAIRDAAPREDEDRREGWRSLSNGQLEFLVREMGAAYEPADTPSDDDSNGRNWSAARLIDDLLSILSRRAGRESAAVFERLASTPVLAAYNRAVLYYAGDQTELTRQQEYVRPSWPDTLNGLFSPAPANVADLHALTVDALLEVQRRARTSNTDTYKAFWNEAARGVIDSPKVEDSCRDRLLDLVRPMLSPNEISAEPEGHMVADKRCDVVVTHARTGKVVVEIKRSKHAEVWTACANQLDRLYTRDPEAKGYGVYVVFWHGGSHCKVPPVGTPRPTSALEMEASLTSLIPDADRHRIRAIVIDVTAPTR